jgi:hypothetical protein
MPPLTLADIDRHAIADIRAAATRLETSSDRFDALTRLGVDVWASERLALAAQTHLCLGWSAERSARALRLVAMADASER